MSVHWLRDLPPHSLVYDDEVCIITQAAFDAIADYTRSQPTGPSPGRVYKRNLHWTGPPDNWFVFVCRPPHDDEEPGYVYHDGRQAVVI